MTLDRLWAEWRSTYVSGIAASALSRAVSLHADPRLRLARRRDAHRVARSGVLCDPQRLSLRKWPPDGDALSRGGRARGPDTGEHAELWVGVRDAVVALKAAYAPDGVNVGIESRRGRGSRGPRPPSRALLAAVGGRHELHDLDRGSEGAPREPRCELAEVASGMAGSVAVMADEHRDALGDDAP